MGLGSLLHSAFPGAQSPAYHLNLDLFAKFPMETLLPAPHPLHHFPLKWIQTEAWASWPVPTLGDQVLAQCSPCTKNNPKGCVKEGPPRPSTLQASLIFPHKGTLHGVSLSSFHLHHEKCTPPCPGEGV